MKELLTEQRNPLSAKRIDQVSTLELARIMNQEDQSVGKAVACEIAQITRAIDAVAAAMRAGHRLFYFI